MPNMNQHHNFTAMVEELINRFKFIWLNSADTLPSFGARFDRLHHLSADRALGEFVRATESDLKIAASPAGDRNVIQRRVTVRSSSFARHWLGFPQEELDLIQSSGSMEVSAGFAREARRFDAHISDADIFQASRNVMTMNFIQMMMGMPVSLTPSIFAYSMLYPYTDNYLDDPAISTSDKAGFVQHFRQRLDGQEGVPANQTEAQIWELVGMVERQYPREDFPLVHESLLAIHDAQCRSLALQRGGQDVDVLGLTFEKGGTSVLADGYLVASDLTPGQMDFMFAYGCFTQLMDDLEDVESDRKSGALTLFSQPAGSQPLDGVLNRLFHFGVAAFATTACFDAPAAALLKNLIARAVNPLLIASAGVFPQYFNQSYLRQIEQHLPFSYGALEELRRSLEKQHFSMTVLLNLFAGENAERMQNLVTLSPLTLNEPA